MYCIVGGQYRVFCSVHKLTPKTRKQGCSGATVGSVGSQEYDRGVGPSDSRTQTGHYLDKGRFIDYGVAVNISMANFN